MEEEKIEGVKGGVGGKSGEWWRRRSRRCEVECGRRRWKGGGMKRKRSKRRRNIRGKSR